MTRAGVVLVCAFILWAVIEVFIEPEPGHAFLAVVSVGCAAMAMTECCSQLATRLDRQP